MSMSYDEAAYEQAAYEQYMEELYEKHREEAIEEFTFELLRSYYNENKLLAKPAFDTLSEARKLNELHSSAGVIFAAIAMETGLKTMLLKPIVHGLVHAESVASLITDLAVSHTGMDRYRDLLLRVLQEHGGVDLNTFKRIGANKTLWEEINEIQKIRNLIMHRAEKATTQSADLALAVASEIIDHIFPSVIIKMGFHLHDGYRICSDWKCSIKQDNQKKL
ncbi:MAG TPA: hypothetical protein DCP47_00225 [Phycisphaerales bacterium]|nr:hypothetical protein [Phycisphaerales bacterium]